MSQTVSNEAVMVEYYDNYKRTTNLAVMVEYEFMAISSIALMVEYESFPSRTNFLPLLGVGRKGYED